MVSSGCLMTACSTGTFEISGPTDTACKSFRVIRASKADTVDTKRQVVGHNKAFEAICPGEATSEKKIAAR